MNWRTMPPTASFLPAIMVEMVSMKPLRTMRPASSGTAAPLLTNCAIESVNPVIRILLSRERGELFRRCRNAGQIALKFVTTVHAQEIELLLALHAFGQRYEL